jgi:hypothetical protein
MWPYLSKVIIRISILFFVFGLQSCAPAAVQPASSPVSATLVNSTQGSSITLAPLVETPACTEKMVLPVITDIQPSPALPGNEITITGRGGYIQDSCGGFNESARSFKLYLDDELAGDLQCYVNHCEAKIKLLDTIPLEEHCLSTQIGVCEFRFRVVSE